MNLPPFKLEEYLALYEFKAPYLLCCSDVQTLTIKDILAFASEEKKLAWDELTLGYTEIPGSPYVRERIGSALYPSLQKSNIVCFAGAEEGIFCTLSILLEAEDHVIVLTPCYQSLLELPKAKGCDITTIELEEKNQWKIDLGKIENVIKKNTKVVIINFPHNPTGAVINQEELSALIAILRKKGIWLFSDEVYRLLGQPVNGWAQPAAVAYEKGISLGVMSKAYGLAGLRVGWIAAQDISLLEKVARMKQYTSICNSAPSEFLTDIVLEHQDKILMRNNKIVADNLIVLNIFLQKYNHLFSWVKPEGGCIGFIHYKGNEKVELFTKKLLEKTGVLLMPSSIFDYKGNYFRIGFGRMNMSVALEKLEEYIKTNMQ